ncbi:MAG: hypothetical protein U0935_15665 [Pirellulales bacterium]
MRDVPTPYNGVAGRASIVVAIATSIRDHKPSLRHWDSRQFTCESLTRTDNVEETKPTTYDADAILAELDELEQHLTGDSLALAKAAFQRVFESVTLRWQKVSPRRRELASAEITPRFPF